ncbi:CUB and zona pellucida-like domain-containing protein 1 [Gigantopelta aegis]|uniref:CUB and zona pellucida-like domain-containing protein 1 n=1 Tax=Gigantopelta aegis TaxID=1735272 RepID=UPI001B88977E|nr:CUB and zona pellucida-like domain-containing protein 1 [Gigantopelta aegis]
MHLNFRGCRSRVNDSVITLGSSMVGCGMQREESPTDIIYRNKLRILQTPTRSGQPRSESYDLECRVSRSASVVGNFRMLSQLTVIGYGNASLRFDFYQDSGYRRMFMKYPIEVKSQQVLFAAITLTTADTHLTIALEQCVGLPSLTVTNNFKDQNTYMLFRNKCPTESTIKYRPAKPNEIRFQFQAFNFLQRSKELYVRCDVYVCGKNTTSPRCRRGCPAESSRFARSPDNDGTVVKLAQGPIVSGETENQDGQTGQPVGLISGAIGGVVALVVVVTMVLALLKMKFGTRVRRHPREDNTNN